MGQSSATPSSSLTLKSEGCSLGKCALQWMVLPPTALYIEMDTGEASAFTG